VLPGYAVSAIDATPGAGLTVKVGNAKGVTTDSQGFFQAEVSAPGAYDAVITAASIVERHTRVSVPPPEPVRLSLIPASFDLQAFDEMFRTTNARLQRWTTQPSLVILASAMALRDGSGGVFTAMSEQMTDDEVTAMTADLVEGLSLLTGGTYASYARIDVERPAAGERVNVWRDQTIVVGRYEGVMSTAGTIGHGQWAEEADGTITAGATFLDREFDRTDDRRRLVRIHELGHALGYQHVTSRLSIMNPAVGPPPTDFDRAAAIIAFQRPPGNRTPDTDPAPAPKASAKSLGRARWSKEVF
jgi:hypothetical protein